MITTGDMWLATRQTERGELASALGYGAATDANLDAPPAPLAALAIAGVPHGLAAYAVRGLTTLGNEMVSEPLQTDGDSTTVTYALPARGLTCSVRLEVVPGSAVFRAETTVRNVGDAPVTLTHASSIHVPGIATGGVRKWDDPARVRIHYCRQTWEGEGQWRQGTLEELGLLRTSVHDVRAAAHFASTGSFSTANMLPMLVVEDRERSKVWYVQVETSSPWHIEVGFRAQGPGGALFLNADGADERFGAWSRTLAPGENFTTVPAAFGCCDGGFNDAVRELTAYRRARLKPAPAWEGPCPVAFNDYMNCLWADPNRERLEPLVAAAADAGAEVFTIDAGWFGPVGRSWGMGLGDWEPSPDRFGEAGLQGMLDHIRGKGMIPGIWLEMEVCGEDAALGGKPDAWFLRRHGKRVGGGARWFLNFANPEVRQYLHGVIDRLTGMGVGFIKNDYNECVGAGDETLAAFAADGLLEHARAFLTFIDEVRARHPKLILENCGSGAMRQDYGTLSHFHLQSTSDQEWFWKYPSIVMGSAMAIAPEQLGVWTYPMPLYFDDMGQPGTLLEPAYQARMANGEETIFNMVSGLCGNMYLSGRIDVADVRNRALIQEGVARYKAERSFIHEAFPFWPQPFTPFGQDDAWASLGLMNAEGSRVLLAVWRLSSAQPCHEMTIHGWAGVQAEIRQIYPAEGYAADCAYNARRGTVTVRFERTRQARYFELVRKGS